jgi:pyruvate kinase
MKQSKAQIVATLGPASARRDVLKSMIMAGVDVIRLNFSWGTREERVSQILMIRAVAKECGRHIPIIIDLPGPRVQGDDGHTYHKDAVSALTYEDRLFIGFAVEQGVEYVAVSFVGGPQDIVACRNILSGLSGTQKVIAKIERAVALDSLDAIIAEADAVMVARGDLGNEIPLEKVPFVQESIIRAAKSAGKPVITATQMMLSMVRSATPTRAEVTDVAHAILQGSDAVMLSEESAIGAYPVEAVSMMERIVLEAERHVSPREDSISSL